MGYAFRFGFGFSDFGGTIGSDRKIRNNEPGVDTDTRIRNSGLRREDSSTSLKALSTSLKPNMTQRVLVVCPTYLLGASEITANLYCNCVHLYWEGCVICSLYIYETLCMMNFLGRRLHIGGNFLVYHADLDIPLR